MNILVIHEVSYLDKPVYEYQDFPERLASLGHKVTVIDFCETRSGKLSIVASSKTGLSKIKLISLPNIGIPILKYLFAKIIFPFQLKGFIDRLKPDAILLYSVFINGSSTIKVAKRNNIPVIFRAIDSYHLLRKNFLESQILKSCEKYIYKNASFLSVSNEKMRDYVKSLGGLDANSLVRVLDHGVDTEHFKRLPRDEALAKQLNISSNDFVCLFLGTTYSFSRLDQIVESMPKLLTTNPNFKLLVLGSGELDLKVNRSAKDCGVSDRVIQTGMIPYQSLPKFLSLANIAINPFEINSITKDIIPIKMLQYLSSELPVVSTPLPDLIVKIPQGSGGVWYSRSDSLEDFLSGLRDVVGTMDLLHAGKTGRNYVTNHFSIQKAVKNLEEILGQRWNT